MSEAGENKYQVIARELAKNFAPRAAKWDENREYCWDNVRDMVDAGLMGMTIPTELGGAGASYHDTVLVIEELAKVCTLSARIAVEANMGGISAVMAYGNAFQRSFTAPFVLAGDKPAICITEPNAGSAATEMTTTARYCRWSLYPKRQQTLDYRWRYFKALCHLCSRAE